eukprot:CAMPEP_0171389466 /NCGR_PEP_ID=MMETSP0880-20121228/23_1 /TAXON_ID=67004 /ORGANISM="Thalassiosira weissflogii, Strain CCMP1336" /LENGTH=40 /DNA_ID= /DNA_START= /DNA_END= /DNA_ORIENTATION=
MMNRPSGYGNAVAIILMNGGQDVSVPNQVDLVSGDNYLIG